MTLNVYISTLTEEISIKLFYCMKKIYNNHFTLKKEGFFTAVPRTGIFSLHFYKKSFFSQRLPIYVFFTVLMHRGYAQAKSPGTLTLLAFRSVLFISRTFILVFCALYSDNFEKVSEPPKRQMQSGRRAAACDSAGCSTAAGDFSDACDSKPSAVLDPTSSPAPLITLYSYTIGNNFDITTPSFLLQCNKMFKKNRKNILYRSIGR